MENKKAEQPEPEIKKVAEKPKPKSNELHYYQVKVETLIPAVLEYKILAHSPEEAARMYLKKDPINIQYKLRERRDKSLSIYAWGTLLLFIKKMLGPLGH